VRCPKGHRTVFYFKAHQLNQNHEAKKAADANLASAAFCYCSQLRR
jgi:hypothetical protein